MEAKRIPPSEELPVISLSLTATEARVLFEVGNHNSAVIAGVTDKHATRWPVDADVTKTVLFALYTELGPVLL